MQYLAVILGIFGLDIGIKNHIEKTKTEDVDELRAGGAFIIRKHHNKGAFLNAGENRQKAVMVLSVLLSAALTVFYVVTLGNAGKGMLKWGLTLLLGGAYSNTYDRLTRKYVVDYLSFNVPWKWLRRIIFNIGDFCIMIGALISTLGYYRQ
ncbi:MAG: signal peptidase II [Lachnospiraceae bacterium]|nr:signal peptidase II [Lachnospiraceae bacterium]